MDGVMKRVGKKVGGSTAIKRKNGKAKNWNRTDLGQGGEKIVSFYPSSFQIEFL
jgi:hypothetical protein